MLKLTEREVKLLQQVVESRAPDFNGVLAKLGNSRLNDGEREALQQILLNEMYARGLKDDDEPNELGIQVDSIIGKLENY